MAAVVGDPTIDGDVAWAAVERRDRLYDGTFVTGVLTTGIYCRPSCGARHPFREHVRFFRDGAAARQLGLRACKRCLPDTVARDVVAVASALRLLAKDTPPDLAELARAVGYAPHHFLRLFRREVGVTPADYARGIRLRRVEDALMTSASVTDAIYDAGYASASRFYADATHRLAMTPAQWRHGGEGVAVTWSVATTPLGHVLVATTDRGICHVVFDDVPATLLRRFPRATTTQEVCPCHVEIAIDAVSRKGARPDLPVDVQRISFELLLRRELLRTSFPRRSRPTGSPDPRPTPLKEPSP
jgi:AraC family transcriptional regulator, regulatory protein of adaptative response / methylated-DNA-[protein]-cysteine methyltransferase